MSSAESTPHVTKITVTTLQDKVRVNLIADAFMVSPRSVFAGIHCLRTDPIHAILVPFNGDSKRPATHGVDLALSAKLRIKSVPLAERVLDRHTMTCP